MSLITLAVLMILAANTLFLGAWYARQNRSLFFREYEDIRAQFTGPDKTILELLREKDSRTGFLFYITTPRLDRMVLTSSPDFLPDEAGEEREVKIPKEQRDFIRDHRDILRRGDQIYGQVYRADKEQMKFDLVFAAALDTKHMLVIVRPVEQLDEHTAVANQFMLIVGFLTLLVSVVIARASAKSVVRPIREITEIGERIADLDFSHRYTGTARDETGILGNSINRISTRLDTAMRELKETNSRLQTEMTLQKRFFAGVSHEFKTPVGLIRGYAESLHLGLAETPEDLREYTGVIMEETDRLNHLVSDILFLVKSESAKFVINPQESDIIHLLEKSLEKNRPLIEKKGIRLECEYPSSLTLTVDKNRIVQIFDNLMSNALRHTPPGGRLAVKVLSEESGASFVIENEGDPVPPEHLSHLFEPFYSAFESRDKGSSGTGLGLSIVKSLVEKHGGQCGIENIGNDPQGVRAWFRLPHQNNG